MKIPPELYGTKELFFKLLELMCQPLKERPKTKEQNLDADCTSKKTHPRKTGDT